jgi:HEAT repeat protein
MSAPLLTKHAALRFHLFGRMRIMRESMEFRRLLLDDIRQRLKSDSEVERLCAVRATILTADVGTIPLLLQMVKEDPCPQVRATAALAIGILAKNDDPHRPLAWLAEVLRTDTHDQVRVMVAGAMHLLAMGTNLITDDPSLVEICLKALHDSHPCVVIAAIKMLEEVKSDVVEVALQQVLSHPNWWVRMSAAEALAVRGWRAAELWVAIERLLQECPPTGGIFIFVDEEGNINEKTAEEHLRNIQTLLSNS